MTSEISTQSVATVDGIGGGTEMSHPADAGKLIVRVAPCLGFGFDMQPHLGAS